MKVFRYKKGRVAGKTMTVKELREALAEFPEDMPVMAEWEGVLAYIERSNFAVEKAGKGYAADEEISLLIDVNEY